MRPVVILSASHRVILSAAKDLLFAVVAVTGLVACDSGPRRPPSLHQYTTSYDFVISPDQAPPHVLEDIHYMITVHDRKTGQLIESGIGQLFAGIPVNPDIPNGAQSKTYDGMEYGPEVGKYKAKLNFVRSGTWAVAIRFQRDSLHPLERTDWLQDVLPERDTTKP